MNKIVNKHFKSTKLLNDSKMGCLLQTICNQATAYKLTFKNDI